jgi:hypothetical protein
VDFFRALEAACPEVECQFIALDNWSVHLHPDILWALLDSKIMLLRLPTYAPLGPIRWKESGDACIKN